jgi:hypothetical protein
MPKIGLRRPKQARHPWALSGGRPLSLGYGGEASASLQRFERWSAMRREAWARDLAAVRESLQAAA